MANFLDKLIKKYAFEDINQAVEDSEKGKTIKSVLLIVYLNVFCKVNKNR